MNVRMPDGTLVKNVPDNITQADLLARYEAFKTPDTRGNIINTDVPTVVGQVANPPVNEPKRSIQEKMMALYEVPATMLSGAALTIPSAVSALATGEAPMAMAQRNMYQPRSGASQDVLQSIGSAFEATKLPPVIPTTGMLPSYARMAQATTPQVRQGGQIATQTVRETAQPVVNRMAEALRKEPKLDVAEIAKTAPSVEELATQSSQLFKQAKESNVELNAKDFSNTMKTIGKDLREEGYDPRLYPKLDVAFSELQNAKVPKDFSELRTLRKFIQGAQKSTDLEEKRLATILKDEFDTYVANIPESSVKAGSKEGLDAWKQARDAYTRMSKGEIFEDMLENAQLDTSKFSMSGIENSLAQQLRQLAKNDKKMRMFTLEEQAAIKDAVKGGKVQNMLRFFGKFAPTSSVSSIPAILTTAASAPLGLTLTGGAIGGRYLAQQIRKSDVKNLAALMRAGAKKRELSNE
jgi:hypothetical protein